ncbi:ABC transporter substrate-binding protein [Acidovorax sp. JG5]|uniref:ABC transporter substrate-binding protein n=1 Tax=Acidovorax sp. JG5 TaxID=2822718 RepID=UPI001B3393F1|nr:ABC transporter substrate-binding protein [Acidovorax sp. JG5]MBP3981720.1 ABC transporter substrate-binding protein [Acidovorax sp. JG5]
MPVPPVSRRAFGALSALSAVAACAPASWAQAPGTAAGRITIAVGGQAVLYHLPLTIADRLGFFQAEGLDVVVQDFAGGALALQAVRNGVAQVCSGAYEHTLRQQSRGQDYRAFVLQGRAPQQALGVSVRALPGYRGPADLRGRRIGVSAPGSSTQVMASVLLARAGVDVREVSFVGVGAGATALAALRSGHIHALCHADPIMALLEQRGEVRLVSDLRTLNAAQEVFGGAMPASCLYAPQAFLQKEPLVAQALANAMVHALKWLQTAAPADLVRAVPASDLLGNRAVYLAAFNRVRETFSPHGLMPEDGPATALRALAKIYPGMAGPRASLQRSYTNDLARKAREKFGV